MRNILKVVALGDLHYGNPKLGAEQLYHKSRKYLYPELREAELCIITGDLYDQLLTVNSKAHRYATLFITDLLQLSATTGMQIRVLHGTYTHDRDQLSIFETMGIKDSRIRVLDQICVEEITDLHCGMDRLNMSLRVAYLPDNLPYKDSADALAHLKRILVCQGWPYVDMVVGHGSFAHVLTTDLIHKPPCLYTMEQFTSVVPRGPIVMGHIHTPGRTKNVLYCGSFDRMAHNEEEAKGFYVLTRDAAGTEGWRNRFVENKEAQLFITITPQGDDPTAIVHDFVRQVKERFPDERGHVRVLHPASEIRALLHKVCLTQFPELKYSSKSNGDREKSALKIEDIQLDVFDDVKPDEHNLGQLVWQYLQEHQLVDGIQEPIVLERVQQLMMI